MGLKNKLSGVHIQIHSKLRWWIINCPIDIQFCRICVYHCKPMYTCILYTPFSDPLGYRPPPHFHLKWRSLFKIQIDWGMVHTCRNGVLRKELDVGSHCWIPLFINWSLAKHIPYSTGFDFEFGIFFWAGLGFFFGFLGWYHLPSVCNGLELEFVILHGICHIWACSPSILHGIYYMWACSPSILYGICHILACSPSILHGIYYMWACSPSILYGICHILACSPSILHGMFYMWACSPKYLQMRKLGIR